jgi:ssDNA-binding Zn-finger/Zn-ribbon topoisomerase 1
MRRFECPHCKECPTVEEWNEYNKLAIITFGYLPLPEAYDEEDDASSLDCPECEERVIVTDMMEV